MINQIRKRLNRYHFADPGYDREREHAAVLLPIIDSIDPCLLLTLRSARLDSHGGEVAWPGGKKDRSDKSLIDTALRESEEEIGLIPDQVDVICELRPFISKFGLLVTPFVGLVEKGVQLSCNEDEIASIFRVPLKYLLDDPRTDTHVIERHGERHCVPEYHYEGFRIWGLTAMILVEFMIHGLGMDISDARTPIPGR
jgi:8-oxo-dGTP pyrophosphatase MutT (NUDIX family)